MTVADPTDMALTLARAQILQIGNHERTDAKLLEIAQSAAVNRKDQATAVPYTIFSPEDLALVNGGPSGRRDLLASELHQGILLVA